MTKRPECSNSEDIVRAVRSADYDGIRFCSSLFLGSGISVARLIILGLSDLFPIFHQELDRPEKEVPNMVIGVGEINVGSLKTLGFNHNQKVVLTVEEDPTPKNPAHAIIPQKITRGLSNAIARNLTFRPDPNHQS